MKGEMGKAKLKLKSEIEKRIISDDEIYTWLVACLVDTESFPYKKEYSSIFFGESKPMWLYYKLSTARIAEAEKEALDIKRTRLAGTSAQVDQVLIEKALDGDLKAIKLYYERLEGWSVNNKIEVKADDSLTGMLESVFNQKIDGSENAY